MSAPATDARAERAARCRLCGGELRFEFVASDRNRGLGREHFRYFRCRSCRCVLQPEVPASLARHYAPHGYGSASEGVAPELVRREEAKLDLMRPYASAGRLVEIGPGPGLFTRAALAAGFEPTVVEMDPDYCAELRALGGVEVLESSDPAGALVGLEPAAAIVMWHVIEHLDEPWVVLRSCVAKLRPGGVLAISTPNPESLQFRLLGRYWAHVDAPRHLQLLPARTLSKGLGELGMRHVLTTTTDPVGVECNRLGWEYVLRRFPASRPAGALTLSASRLIAAASWPVERRDLQGAAYTSLFLLDHGEY